MKYFTEMLRMCCVIVCIAFFNCSCFKQFYKTNTVSILTAENAESLNEKGLNVILHYGSDIAVLSNVSVVNDTISGIIKAADSIARKYSSPSSVKPNRYERDDKNSVTSQVHLYLNDRIPSENQFVYIPRSNITRFDRYDIDKKATQKSTKNSFIAMGVTLLALALVFLISLGSAFGSLGG